jgi:hypothetical protein
MFLDFLEQVGKMIIFWNGISGDKFVCLNMM